MVFGLPAAAAAVGLLGMLGTIADLANSDVNHRNVLSFDERICNLRSHHLAGHAVQAVVQTEALLDKEQHRLEEDRLLRALMRARIIRVSLASLVKTAGQVRGSPRLTYTHCQVSWRL